MTAFPGRLPGLAPEDWDDEVTALLQGTLQSVGELEGAPPGGPPRRPIPILPVIAHQPRLLGPFLAWSSAIALHGVLSRRDSELLALRAAHNCGSDFEWRHHSVFARAVGITDDEIARVADGPAAGGWAPRESVLLRAADQLHQTASLPQDTWVALSEQYDPAALVELVLVVGQYTMLSMLANVCGVVDDEGPRADGPSTPPSGGVDRQQQGEAG